MKRPYIIFLSALLFFIVSVGNSQELVFPFDLPYSTIKPLDMPLVDITAKDNKPEDIIRHLVFEKKSDFFLLLVGVNDDEYDRIAGAALTPEDVWYDGENYRWYGSYNIVDDVVRIPNEHKMFGITFKRRFDRGGERYFLRLIDLYEKDKLVGKQWRIFDY